MERIQLKFSFNGINYEWAGDFDKVGVYADQSLVYPRLSQSAYNQKHNVSVGYVNYEDYEEYNQWSIELDAFDGDDYHFEVFFSIKHDEADDTICYDNNMLSSVNVWNDTENQIEVEGEIIGGSMFEQFEVSFKKVRGGVIKSNKKETRVKAEPKSKPVAKSEPKPKPVFTLPDGFRIENGIVIYTDYAGQDHEIGEKRGSIYINWNTGKGGPFSVIEKYCKENWKPDTRLQETELQIIK